MSLTTDQIIAKAIDHRQKLTFPFIAITGSNGKTTTKRMLCAILKRAGRVYDFDYHSDIAPKIAQELLNLENSYDWALVKLGALAPESIRISAQIVKPLVGIITNIGEAHLQQHGSIKKIAESKLQLLHYLLPEGVAILNRDNEYTRDMANNFSGKKYFFGLSEISDFYASNIENLGPDGTAFTICRRNGPSLRMHMPIFSLGDVYNTLAAVAAADFFKIDDEKIIAALEQDFRLPDGRGVLHCCKNNVRILDDTYDATPQSLMKSTKSLLGFRDYSNRLILIMGDMAELGEQSITMHKMMGHYLAGMPIDIILLIGDEVLHTEKAILEHPLEEKRVQRFVNLGMAEQWLSSELQSGDTILIEGSDKEDLSILVRHLLERFHPAEN